MYYKSSFVTPCGAWDERAAFFHARQPSYFPRASSFWREPGKTGKTRRFNKSLCLLALAAASEPAFLGIYSTGEFIWIGLCTCARFRV
jgi:hypothetical protein